MPRAHDPSPDLAHTAASAVPTSDELFAPVARDVELCYQTFGDPDGEPLLLVMGLGGPMTWWDPVLCRMLAEAGFYVVRYDNRDTGRSSRMRGRVNRRQLVRAFVGGRARAPYALTDLARDGMGLLDHLGLESAHVVGVSMGGMIAQTMALEAPQRVRSMTSMSSTTGKRTAGWSHPGLLPNLIGARRDSREAYVQANFTTWRLIGSPAYPQTDDQIRARAEETFDRGISGSGVLRQMMAVVTQPNRERRLGSLRVPTLVIHGLADKMVHVSGGRATAAAIPGAELLLVDGMGHDLPGQLFETFTGAIRRNADRAG